MKKILFVLLTLLIASSAYAIDLKDFVVARDADATPGSDSLVYCVDDPGGTPLGKKCTLLSMESALEGFLDLENLQGAVTDSQVPNNITVTLSGTATALAANGGNCSSGQAPLGVDASGAVESCFDVWTEAENTSAGYAPLVSPSFTTPTLGVATATSVNKVAITAPATGSTLTIADGKTLTATNTVNLNTMTDGKWCKYSTAGTALDCNVDPVTDTDDQTCAEVSGCVENALTHVDSSDINWPSLVNGLLGSAGINWLDIEVFQSVPTNGLNWVDVEVLKGDGSGDCPEGKVCFGGHEHSGYESATSNDIDPDRLAGDTVDDNLIDEAIIDADIARDSELPTVPVKWGYAIETPVDTDDVIIGEVASAETYTSIYCKTLVGTVDLDVTIGGADINGTDITCTTTGVLDETLAGDTSGAVGDEVALAITSVASDPTYLIVILNGTKD